MFAGQKVVGAEAKQLLKEAKLFDKNVQKWIAAVDKVDDAVKTFGDAENFLTVIGDDIAQITADVAQLIAVQGSSSTTAASYTQTPNSAAQSAATVDAEVHDTRQLPIALPASVAKKRNSDFNTVVQDAAPLSELVPDSLHNLAEPEARVEASGSGSSPPHP